MKGAGLVAALGARCAFPSPGSPLTCAVSGGADSSALLVLAVAAGCQVTAIHVDHGLRPGSEREADRVADLARRFGAAFRGERVTVAPGPNLEARARAARYQCLPPDVATGHTADDQAETMLINLLRGAGPTGTAALAGQIGTAALAGRPAGFGRIRPILGLRRHETKALCAELDIEPVDDSMNRDPRFLRSRVRYELLPFLAELSGRDPVPVLCRQAGHFRALVDLVGGLAQAVDPTDAAALAAAHPAVAAEAVRGWLRATSSEGHPPRSATVERVLAVARGSRRATEVGGGWRVARLGDRLVLQRCDVEGQSGRSL